MWWLHVLCSMVGRSIADIYPTRGAIFTEAQSMPLIGYRSYGPPYHSIYDILYGECATDERFCVRRQNILKWHHFLLGGCYAIYQTSLQYVISYGCAIIIQYIDVSISHFECTCAEDTIHSMCPLSPYRLTHCRLSWTWRGAALPQRRWSVCLLIKLSNWPSPEAPSEGFSAWWM